MLNRDLISVTQKPKILTGIKSCEFFLIDSFLIIFVGTKLVEFP